MTILRAGALVVLAGLLVAAAAWCGEADPSIDRLRAEVRLREKALAKVSDRFKKGLASDASVDAARRALAEARVRLADARGDSDVVVRQLKMVEAFAVRQAARVGRLASAGAASSAEFDAALLDVAEARLRLAEAQKDDAKILMSLNRIVAYRTKGLERIRLVHEAGKASDDELRAAEIDVAEARIRRAEAKGDRAAILEDLKAIVGHRTTKVEDARRLFAAGRCAEDDVRRAEEDLIRAKARLEAAEKAAKPAAD